MPSAPDKPDFTSETRRGARFEGLGGADVAQDHDDWDRRRVFGAGAHEADQLDVRYTASLLSAFHAVVTCSDAMLFSRQLIALQVSVLRRRCASSRHVRFRNSLLLSAARISFLC